MGIDLGNFYKLLCIYFGETVESEIVPNHGYNTFPSVIAYTHNDKYIGTEAKEPKDLNQKMYSMK